MIRYAYAKVGMTSSFTPEGSEQGVTLLKLLPSKVLRVEELKSGKKLVVIEYDSGKNKKITKGWQVDDASAFTKDAALSPPMLSRGQTLKINGQSKGKGFQDAMTRHGFAGGPASHGSRFHRAPGSAGMRTEPGRTPKGKRFPGHMGDVRVTILNSEVAYWSAEESVLAVRGGVPGARGSFVFI